MRPTRRRTAAAIALLLGAGLASGCSLVGGSDDPDAGDGAAWVPSASLTSAGEELAASAGLAGSAPTYDVRADVDPGTGELSGLVRAELPADELDDGEVLMRYFAGIPAFGAAADVGEVRVGGEVAEATVDDALLSIALPEEHADRVEVEVPFSYTIPMAESGGGLLDALGGMGGPADIGLLSRHDDALNLGHWFPLWIPAGSSAEPDPGGFGDIGNAPAALVRMRLTTPEAWTVIDGGVRTDEVTAKGSTTVTSEGYGMNDLAVSVVKGYVTEQRTLGGELAGVTVTAHGPRGSEEELAGVLAETVASLEVLSEHFADYPWREFDIVSAPLGAGVGGMEWPGLTWIEPSLFAGGIPGLGGLGDVLGGIEGLEGLDDLLGGLGGDLGGIVGGDAGRMIETMRAWTIAHEVGHEWWHVVVGNDSVLDPSVDEPLAQFSACLVIRELEAVDPREADGLCDTHIRSAYEQMRLLGDKDAPAAQTTGDFASSTQYAGVVYGKAAAFYRVLEERLGRAQVAAALGAVTETHAFEMLTADELRDALSRELDDPRFDRLWARWMERTHGDTDLDVDVDSSADGYGGLGGGADGDLDALLEQLLGDRADPEQLDDLLGSLLGDTA